MPDSAQPTGNVDLLHHIVASSQTGIMLLEAVRDDRGHVVDFRFGLINPAAVAITGLSAGDVPEKSYLSHFTQAVNSDLLATYRQVLDTGVSAHLPAVLCHADGINGWFDLQITKYRDALLITITDITTLRQSALDNEQQNQFLDSIFNASQEAVCVLEAVREADGPIVDFRYTRVNNKFETTFGVTAGVIIGTSYLSRYPHAGETSLYDQFCQVVDTGQTFRREIFYDGDGVQGWFDITAVNMGDAVVSFSRDITTRKKAELEQQRQADFLSQILQTSTSGIVMYEVIRAKPGEPTVGQQAPDGAEEDPGDIVDFRAVFFNSAYETIFEESFEAISNKTFRERFNQQPDDELFQFYRQLVVAGLSFRRERYYPRIGKWLNLSGTKLDNGFLIIANDVTDRRRAETSLRQQAEALLQANEELARTNENLQQFAYVASHDLQEPLRKIQAFGSLLRGQYAASLEHQGVDMLARMESAAARMSMLIRDLLALSQLTSKSRSYQPQSLNAIVESVLTVLEFTVQEAGAIVEVGALGTVPGDATQLTQLLQNILSNALKFTTARPTAVPPHYPHIRISGRTVSRTELPPGFQPTGASATYQVIAITDNGIGFNPGQADRIFAPFQRLHNKNEYPGTGIGLSIARRVVENHKGCIVAESQPGEGATFRIYLPVE